MLRRKTAVVWGLIVIALFFVTLQNLVKLLPRTENEIVTNKDIEEAIYLERKKLPTIYHKQPEQPLDQINLFLENLKVNAQLEDFNLQELWREVELWPSSKHLTNISSPNIGKVLHALKYSRITKADIDTRGTQLKILLTLQGGQQCIFKPKWYPIEKIIEGPVFAGKDRYGAELVAFYLSVFLNLPLTPPIVQRTISLKYDVLPVATSRLLNTTFERKGQTCVYGKCYYCHKDDPICDNNEDLLLGAVIYNFKKTFSNYRSPWQRTYKKKQKALWEVDPKYCNNLKNKLSRKRLLDLIDTAIFDFLIQNGDRHHYETFADTVVWIDNGKGLGNPHIQHLDILAPLYQCCVLRTKTWEALLALTGGNLSTNLKLMPDIEHILTDSHRRAMEERILLIFATVEYCKKRNKMFE